MLIQLDGADASTFVYDNLLSGSGYIQLAGHTTLTSNDFLVAFSIDGVQLYQNKQSDTWIAIWILLDLSPNQQYKKKNSTKCDYSWPKQAKNHQLVFISCDPPLLSAAA